MLTGKRFTLKKSTIAVDVINGKRTAIMIPAEGIVTVLPGANKNDRTVEVLWEGRMVVMFAVDVTERGTEIRSRSATSSIKLLVRTRSVSFRQSCVIGGIGLKGASAQRTAPRHLVTACRKPSCCRTSSLQRWYL
jgi:hypothetical protein